MHGLRERVMHVKAKEDRQEHLEPVRRTGKLEQSTAIGGPEFVTPVRTWVRVNGGELVPDTLKSHGEWVRRIRPFFQELVGLFDHFAFAHRILLLEGISPLLFTSSFRVARVRR